VSGILVITSTLISFENMEMRKRVVVV